MTITEEHVSQLASMGFSATQAREALTITSGNLEHAVNFLLGGGNIAARAGDLDSKQPASNEDDSASNDSVAAKAGGILRAPISQYSVEHGRSACTCIALTAATQFLQDQTVTSEFLQKMITKGVDNYQTLASRSSSSNVEHLSAEEVLQQDQGKVLFPIESSRGSIQQGVLSNDSDHPLGLKALLEDIRREQYSDWMVILMTKTPETVLLCFPPDSASPSSYWLIDSHPRPQLGVDSAYAKIHPNLTSLCLSLQAIFPCTDLGPDVPEMIQEMYNTFDLYPLK